MDKHAAASKRPMNITALTATSITCEVKVWLPWLPDTQQKKKRQVDTLKTTDWLKVNIHNCFTSFSIMSIVAAILPASYNNFAVKWSLETVVPGKYVKSRTKNFWQPWPQSAKIKIESVLQLCVCVCVSNYYLMFYLKWRAGPSKGHGVSVLKYISIRYLTDMFVLFFLE